jgi:hypothetical protein
MMRGKIAVIAIASVVIYLLLVSTLYFASAFMVSWGGETPWYLKLIAFLQDTPFNLTRGDGEIKMSLIFINALFWTLCIAGILYFTARIVNKKA